MSKDFGFNRVNIDRPLKPIKLPTIPTNSKTNALVLEHAKAWVCTMLYNGPKKLDFFVREGCKVMIYESLEYEDLVNLLISMVDDGFISLSKQTDEYTLSLKGVFEVKKRTIIPLLNLTENAEYAKEFLQKNKENCDVTFINELISLGGSAKREIRILDYCKNNYHKIATILTLLVKGVSGSGGVATL